MRFLKSFLLILPFLFAALPLAAQADPATAAAERIKERLAQVDVLKAAGQIGESARGYISPIQELPPRQASLLQAENADRRLIYESVANRTGQSVDEVGVQRALRIAEIAKSGVWLQRPDGAWYQKP